MNPDRASHSASVSRELVVEVATRVIEEWDLAIQNGTEIDETTLGGFVGNILVKRHMFDTGNRAGLFLATSLNQTNRARCVQLRSLVIGLPSPRIEMAPRSNSKLPKLLELRMVRIVSLSRRLDLKWRCYPGSAGGDDPEEEREQLRGRPFLMMWQLCLIRMHVTALSQCVG
jgi:hypothetical protein